MSMPGGAWTVYAGLAAVGAVWFVVVMAGVAFERLRHPRKQSLAVADQPIEHRVAA